MNVCLAVMLTALASSPDVPAAVERDGVRVEVVVQAQEFMFAVTNVSAPPIVRFEVDNYHTYNHLGPRDWTVEFDDRRMRCTADEPRRAITRGRTERFMARVGSNSAAIGVANATVGFGPDHEPIELAVWAPVRHPRSFIATIALTLAGIAIAHGVVMGRRQGRSSPR